MNLGLFNFPRRLIRQAAIIALMAMVMLVSAPTVSRLIAHYSGAQTLVALCTSHGIMWVSINPANDAVDAASFSTDVSNADVSNADVSNSNAPKQSKAAGKNCGYCSPHLSAVALINPALTSVPAYAVLARLPALAPPRITSEPLRLPLQARAPPASLFI